MTTERQFLGEWRQTKPNAHPASIFIEFQTGGRLKYTIEADTVQYIFLTWHLEGDVIVSDQPTAPAEARTQFRFVSPSRLVLERDGEVYVYDRT